MLQLHRCSSDSMGTMLSSEFPSAFIFALPPVEFSNRSFLWQACQRREADGTSRFSRLECLQHARVYDSAASSSCLPITHESVLPSPNLNRIGTRKGTDFGAQWLACMDLLHGRSRQTCCHNRPSAEGRNRWLIVFRKTLSFSIPSRFIPALSGWFFGYSVDCELDIPPAEQLRFGGPVGFIVDREDGDIEPITYHEWVDLGFSFHDGPRASGSDNAANA